MNRKRLLTIFGIIYLISLGLFFKDYTEQAVSGSNLTALCLEATLPCMDVIAVESESLEQTETETEAQQDTVTEASSKQETTEKEEPSEKKKEKADGPPRVLIYHTHATESYRPATAGNYHTTQEENTVREAGSIMTETLEARGVSVIHDKTIHDNPSYNSSYERSYETVTAILRENPSIECIIDLHRDAIAGTAEGPTQTVHGKTCAYYSYVVGSTAPTYASNKAFLNKLNEIASSDYDGFTANILERPYYYNQELCDKSILLELGNNRNHIDDVRRSAAVFGEMLADALE
ncbi:MAG: stage II sporulation protein P [Firmicutes bacterium]|nr:stage II sporulation protein P [Bacillota bacterium]